MSDTHELSGQPKGAAQPPKPLLETQYPNLPNIVVYTWPDFAPVSLGALLEVLGVTSSPNVAAQLSTLTTQVTDLQARVAALEAAA